MRTKINTELRTSKTASLDAAYSKRQESCTRQAKT